MELKGDRHAIRKGDQGLQLALTGDQEALGRTCVHHL